MCQIGLCAQFFWEETDTSESSQSAFVEVGVLVHHPREIEAGGDDRIDARIRFAVNTFRKEQYGFGWDHRAK